MKLTIGPHMSIAKGLDQAALQARTIGASTMQVFTRNPRGGKARDIPAAEIDTLKSLCDAAFGPIVAHAPYTVNMASAKEDVRTFARDTLTADLAHATRIGAVGLVVHPGSHGGDGRDIGTTRVVNALDVILSETAPGARLLLETMAGSGNELGSDFDFFTEVFNRVQQPERLGLCLDTCHLFSAGYDLRNWAAVRTDLERRLPFSVVGCCHINDSKTPFASHKDRHETLGNGSLGLAIFSGLLEDADLASLPWILETPNELSGWQQEIHTLRRLSAEKHAAPAIE